MHVLVGLSFSQDGDYHCFTVSYTVPVAIMHTAVTERDAKGKMQRKWENILIYRTSVSAQFFLH